MDNDLDLYEERFLNIFDNCHIFNLLLVSSPNVEIFNISGVHRDSGVDVGVVNDILFVHRIRS